MDTPVPASSPETDEERQRRIAWEREAIAAALAQIDRGEVVDFDDVEAWLDSIGTDNELPRPQPRSDR